MPTKKAPAKKTAVKKVATTKAKPKKKTATPTKVVSKRVAKKSPVKKAPAKKAPAKKAVAKKPTAKKKPATKKESKDLVFAADQESFWTTDGQILNSLVALSDAFDAMDTGVFEFHSAGDQNDFSVWVEMVLCDSDCAAELAKAPTQKKAHTIVNKHLKNYSL